MCWVLVLGDSDPVAMPATAVFFLVIADRVLTCYTFPDYGFIFYVSQATILLALIVIICTLLGSPSARMQGLILAAMEGISGVLEAIAWLSLGLGVECLVGGAVAIVLGFLVAVLVFPTKHEHVSASKPGSSSEYAIELYDVYKDYYVGNIVIHALRGVSMKVRKGEFVAIMGPSGSGKSTLLNLIGALDRPTSGKVLVDGIDLSLLDDDDLAEVRNKKIGFVFQAFNLINRTSVARNVELPAIIAGVPKKERMRRVREILRILGLDETALKRRPNYLSGGQQQRVAIARALMNNPSIILADEPTGNLDSKTGREIMEYLRMLNRKFGTTIVVVTHDRSVAEMADRILHIRDGKIVREEKLDGEAN